jgi:hypothetical protein
MNCKQQWPMLGLGLLLLACTGLLPNVYVGVPTTTCSDVLQLCFVPELGANSAADGVWLLLFLLQARAASCAEIC